MARRAPADDGVEDPTDYIYIGDDEHAGAESDEPIPGWRKPIALAGWGILIAVLIALIVWGIIQLVRGAPPQQPVTNPTPVTATTTTARPSSTASVTPTVSGEPMTTTPTDAPTASTEDTLPSTTPTTPSGEAHPLPHLPSVITLPPLPGLPTEITLPPGL